MSRRAPSNNRRSRPAPPVPDGPVPDDEAFWRRQERRRSVSLAQPCCTLSGMCHLLGRLQDNVAVVIHGDKDCGNSFIHHWMPGADNFFCTNLSEAQTLGGAANDPLAEVLALVVAERRPAAVFVLTSCLIQLTGSDPTPVVARVARSTDVPIVLLRTGGLQTGTQAGTADWLYAELAALPPLPAPRAARGRRRRCNLIGLPSAGIDERELRDILAVGGIEVNGLYPAATTVGDWRRIAHAELHAVADRSLYPRLCTEIAKRSGPAIVEVPLPIGLEQTERFYRAIGEHFGVWDRMARALRPAREALAPAWEAFRARARGRRVALGLRMHNDFRADMLAYGGLADAVAFGELGFDVTLIIQGPVEERERFTALLEGHRYQVPHLVVPHPWHLAPLLKAGRFDVAVMPEHCLEEAQKAGLPLVASRELEPLLSGARRNLVLLEEIIASGRPGAGAAAP